jgi:hypothetical protein
VEQHRALDVGRAVEHPADRRAVVGHHRVGPFAVDAATGGAEERQRAAEAEAHAADLPAAAG